MKNYFTIILIAGCLSSFAQTLHLSSLQHELRWLETTSFPIFVGDEPVKDSILHYVANTVAAKFKTANISLPTAIEYRTINMFGKPKLKAPARSNNAADYDVSVLSFITRATTGLEVLWMMKIEVQQNGSIVYSRETTHELYTYDKTIAPAWFTAESFVASFKTLFNELMETTPPLAYRFILGNGIDYDALLRANSEAWIVQKHRNILGFGQPDFGPYQTIIAEKLDTSVIRNSKKIGTESYVGVAGSSVFFDQYKTVDYSKIKFCQLQLQAGSDSIKSLFVVSTFSTETKRTVAGQLFGGHNDGSNSQTSFYKRKVEGNIFTPDGSKWNFVIENYNPDGTISGTYLTNNKEEYLLEYQQHAGLNREMVLTNPNGEIFASLVSNASQTTLLIRKDVDTNMKHAIAAFYAIVMSVRNLP